MWGIRPEHTNLHTFMLNEVKVYAIGHCIPCYRFDKRLTKSSTSMVQVQWRKSGKSLMNKIKNRCPSYVEHR